MAPYTGYTIMCSDGKWEVSFLVPMGKRLTEDYYTAAAYALKERGAAEPYTVTAWDELVEHSEPEREPSRLQKWLTS